MPPTASSWMQLWAQRCIDGCYLTTGMTAPRKSWGDGAIPWEAQGGRCNTNIFQASMRPVHVGGRAVPLLCDEYRSLDRKEASLVQQQ